MYIRIHLPNLSHIRKYFSNPKVFKTSTFMRNLLIAFERQNPSTLNSYHSYFAPYKLKIATVRLHQSEILLENVN